MSAGTDLWVRRFGDTSDAELRLICFPHAGGAATFFLPLSSRLAPGVEVLAMQYPGRQDRRYEPFIDDIDDLANAIFAALCDGWVKCPFAFFGHSMGAVVAFEVARRFRRTGRCGPLGILASGRRAPSMYRDEQVHRSDDTRLIAEVRRLNGTDSSLLDDDELLRMILPAIRADYRAVERYRYQSDGDLTCPIHVLVGDCDPQVTEAEARAWSAHTSGHFRLRTFPGGHFYLVPLQEAVAAAVSEDLALFTAAEAASEGFSPRLS
jgi:surfactin synthase thioesterase subunit